MGSIYTNYALIYSPILSPLQAVCGTIRSMTAPRFAEYIGKFQIKSLEFESLTLGTLPPTIHGEDGWKAYLFVIDFPLFRGSQTSM